MLSKRAWGAVLASFTVVISVMLVPAARAEPSPSDVHIYPVPQSVTTGSQVHLRGRVSLVVGADTDPSAEQALTTLLKGAGSRVQTFGPGDSLPRGGTVVYLGTEQDNASIAPALQRLGVDGPAAVKALGHAEGYVVATGRARGLQEVVLAGHDPSGTFYAVQTLRQIVDQHGDTAAVTVADWPDFALRGVIEGFYGTPWSHAARLAQLDFYGANKMNTYVYSPKDDDYLRARWRDPYPAGKLAQIKELVDRAIANHVEFTYALSPGLSVCYSSQADEQALVAKFESLWDIGVRTFAIPLDDISYTTWNCDADKEKFGTGGAAAGRAQAYLLNEVQRDFIATHQGASRLEMVPTEYYNTAESPYKKALRDNLDQQVIVEWTGEGVIAPTITGAQAADARQVFGHDILVWDNYPVNDYVRNRLLLGPYVGRDPQLPESLYGIAANPMIEPEASKIALFTVADYTWNTTAYDPDESWQAALTALAGGNAKARTALAAFADLNYSSRIDSTQAPVLKSTLAAFWPAWERGDSSAVAAVDAYLSVIATIPTVLTDELPDQAFVEETRPWLQCAGTWGEAARAALAMLQAQRAGHGAAALADRTQAEKLMAKAQTFQHHGMQTVTVTLGGSVLQSFVQAALAENDRWLGVAGRHVTAMTSMPVYQSNSVDKMVDGDASTYFWSSRPPKAGDYVGVDLGAIEPITKITIAAGDADSPDDYLHVATLEYSTDNQHWTALNTFVNTADITFTPATPVDARYVRLRATEADGNWVKVHEFSVTGPQNEQLSVTGTPAAASDSTLAAAADGNPDTAYTASASPTSGDALTVTLPQARPLAAVVVAGTGQGQVQVRADGDWTTIGSLSAGYTQVSADGVVADAIRLVWTAGSPAPVIEEVVPWYADLPAAAMAVAPNAMDSEVGAAGTINVALTATSTTSVSGTLHVAAPDGVTAEPVDTSVTLARGAQPTYAIALTGTAVGDYTVPITFTPDLGEPVTKKVTVHVRPHVSDTNVALASNGAAATASGTEQDLARFTPDHAIDGDLSTRWSSNYSDSAWLQVQLAAPQHLGKVVIHWEAAHAVAYTLQTSADGSTWTTAASVTGSLGGTETLWIDQSNVRYLRMQGVQRATAYGYSIYELQAYPIA